MCTNSSRGFTLVELLTVIAIISILAALTSVALPRAIERAKITSLKNDFNQIRTALVAYSTQNRDSYPPSYGYLSWDSRSKPANELTGGDYHLYPYLTFIKLHRVFDVYDDFSDSYDTNRNNKIDLLEFSPPGEEKNTELYTGSNLGGDTDRQLRESPRPYIYIPVNRNHAKKVAEYYEEVSKTNPLDGYYARVWDPNHPKLKGVSTPPAKYDDYVLISVGPNGDTRGVLPNPIGTENTPNIYYVTALRAFYLATRDANNNGMFDFDYENRTRSGEGKQQNYSIDKLNLLPMDLADNQGSKPGPIIQKGP